MENADDAIRKAGTLLVQAGYATADYVDAMIRVYHELGSYIVLAPGLALPHARPESGVLKTGFSLITLKNPVRFGHPDNDPVRVVVAMAALDDTEHITALQKLADILSVPGNLEHIAAAKTPEEVLSLAG